MYTTLSTATASRNQGWIIAIRTTAPMIIEKVMVAMRKTSLRLLSSVSMSGRCVGNEATRLGNGDQRTFGESRDDPPQRLGVQEGHGTVEHARDGPLKYGAGRVVAQHGEAGAH